MCIDVLMYRGASLAARRRLHGCVVPSSTPCGSVERSTGHAGTWGVVKAEAENQTAHFHRRGQSNTGANLYLVSCGVIDLANLEVGTFSTFSSLNRLALCTLRHSSPNLKLSVSV